MTIHGHWILSRHGATASLHRLLEEQNLKPQLDLPTDEPTVIKAATPGWVIWGGLGQRYATFLERPEVIRSRIFRGGPWDDKIELDNTEVPDEYKERRVTWHNNGMERRREFCYRRPNYRDEEVPGQSAAAQASDTGGHDAGGGPGVDQPGMGLVRGWPVDYIWGIQSAPESPASQTVTEFNGAAGPMD